MRDRPQKPYGTANLEKPTDEDSAIERAPLAPSPQAIELAARILAKRAMRENKEAKNG
jgi:hypothetical protein